MLVVVALIALATAAGVFAYFTSTGRGTASASVTSLSVPGSPAAAATGGSIQVTWTASTVGGTTAATSYTVERYNGGATELGAADCSPVSSSAGNPNAFGSFSCTDTPSTAGTYKYRITSHYRSWSATTGFTNAAVAGSSTTTLVSSDDPSVSGEQVTYTATVTVSPPGTPTAKVELLDGGTPIAACGGASGQTLSGSAPFTATCQETYNAGGGSHTITAKYLGDSTYPASTSAPLTQTVDKANTTTSVASDASSSVTGQSVTFTATVAPVSPGSGTPTGAVNFKSDGTPITGCSAQTLSGGQASCSTSFNASGGNHTITAVYSNDSNYNASTSTGITQTVNKASTTTSLASSANASVFGQSVTLTATVAAVTPGAGAPTGTVNFRDGGTTIGTCGAQTLNGSAQATCSTSALSVGTHATITAVYSSDTNFTASTSSNLSQTVNQAATTTAIASSANPSVVGQHVTYTATVSVTSPGAGTPGGSVTFKDGVTTITCEAGSVTFNGTTATCKQTYGSVTGGSPHSITAVYGGDVNFTGSTSSALSQTVNQASTTTAITSTSNPSVVGQQVIYTATVAVSSPGSGAPGGTVTFKDGAATITCEAGSGTFNGSTATCKQTYATTTGSPHSITAVYGGDVNFTGSTSSALSQIVNPASTTSSLASSANPSVFGQSVTLTAAVAAVAPGAGTPGGTVNFKDNGATIGTCSAQALNGSAQATCSTSALSVGTHATITAVYSGDANFSASTSSNFSQTVNQASTTTTIVSSDNPSVVNEQVTYTATVAVTAPGAGSPTGSVTFKDGTSAITCETGSATFNGTTATCKQTYTTTTGSPHSITAVYSGDTNFSGSTTATAVSQAVHAAPTATLLGTATDSTSGSGSTTVTGVSTASGATVLILVYRQSSIGGETVSSITGPLTGAQVVQNGTEFNKHNVYVWRAVGNGTTGTVTVNFSGGGGGKNVLTVINVVQLANNDITTPIVQSPPASATSGAATATLAAPAPGNAEIFLLGIGANTTATTPTGFAQLDTKNGATGTGYRFLSGFNAAAQTSASSTLDASNAWGTIGLEIKHG